MSPFLESVESNFGTRDLYQVLGVNKSASCKELRRAYHRISLKVHPDRVEPENVEQATQNFQVLGKIYSILSDSDKRAIYDEDGTIDEEDDVIFKQDRDWDEYWRLLFKKVTIEDVVSFEKSYRGSEEEMEDLKSVYVESEGDMDTILETVLCACISDEVRFRELIEGWITEGSVPAYPAFTEETKAKRMARKRKWKKEEKEAEEMLSSKTNDSEASLSALIKAKQKSREEQMGDFFDSLEEKYCSKKAKVSSSGKKKGASSASKGSKKSKK